MNATDVDRAAATAIAEGSQYTWRDVLGRAMVGRLIEWDFINPDVADQMSIQTLLDSISNTPGSMLMRSPTQWVALVNPDEKAIVGWDVITHMPVWVDQPTAGITELTGAVTAGPGSGPQATTITPTGVTAGAYTNANIIVEADGRIVYAEDGAAISGITELTGPVTAGPGSGPQATTITPTGVIPGTYDYASLQVGADGRLLSAATGTIPTPPTPTEIVPGWVQNRWYTALGVGPGVSWPINTLTATLLRVPINFEADECAITVTVAAASSQMTIGIYENDNGVPGALIAVLGVIATNTTGTKFLAFPHITAAGPYIWFASYINIAITTTQNSAVSFLTTEVFGNDTVTTSTSPLTGWRVAQAYVSGVMPDPYPSSPIQNQAAPAVWLRRT